MDRRTLYGPGLSRDPPRWLPPRPPTQHHPGLRLTSSLGPLTPTGSLNLLFHVDLRGKGLYQLSRARAGEFSQISAFHCTLSPLRAEPRLLSHLPRPPWSPYCVRQKQ